MQLRYWVIAIAVVGAVSLGISGVLKSDSSGFLGVLSSLSWVVFLISVLVLVCLGVVALLRHERNRRTATGA